MSDPQNTRLPAAAPECPAPASFDPDSLAELRQQLRIRNLAWWIWYGAEEPRP